MCVVGLFVPHLVEAMFETRMFVGCTGDDVQFVGFRDTVAQGNVAISKGACEGGEVVAHLVSTAAAATEKDEGGKHGTDSNREERRGGGRVVVWVRLRQTV